MIDVLFQ